MHANVASLEDLIDQPTITQIVLHVPVIQALKVTFSLKSTKNSSGLCYARCRGETLEVVKVGPQQKDGLQYKAIMSKPQNVEHTMYFIGIQNKKKKRTTNNSLGLLGLESFLSVLGWLFFFFHFVFL